jgi:alkanesulfonate monooxygenase SsuD/methylene tetrahydromethanopterin reductase-like flavin-dependent oxidoreductase (luciferase family)
LKFGIVYPNKGEYVDPKLAMQAARLAEECGFEFFLTWDHYMLPNENSMFDAWSLLSYLAGGTSRIRLGTCVTPIPFRPPAMLAKIVASLDSLSDGRVILGVGAGWHRPEFEAYSAWDDGKTRVAKTREGLELMTRLWTEPSVNIHGRFYRVIDAALEPKPRRKPYPEMWFGTTGPEMLKLASRFGSGWIPTMISAKEYRGHKEKLSGLIAARERRGKKKDFSYVYNLFDPLMDARSYARSIEEFSEAGCDRYAINWKYEKEFVLERIRWFAREVKSAWD